MFGTVGLIGKHGDERVGTTLDRLVRCLHGHGAGILMDAHTATGLPTFGLPVVERAALGARSDLVIVVGGDGTFLGAARSLVDCGVPLVGVNQGRLGFLVDILPAEMEERIAEIFAGDYVEQPRFLLEVEVRRADGGADALVALNEVVAHKLNIARLITFEARIDDRLVSSQRSDGLIVATPTGSTAYALSGGGPLLHADLDAMVLVPICPHTLSSRPLVVAGTSAVEIRLDPSSEEEALLTADGQETLALAPGDRIMIRKKAPALRLVHPSSYDYFGTLRAKLHWAHEP